MILKMEKDAGDKKAFKKLLNMPRDNAFLLTLCIRETPNQVLLQTVKTQMKCSIMLHFIRVYTVYKGKERSLDERIQFF